MRAHAASAIVHTRAYTKALILLTAASAPLVQPTVWTRSLLLQRMTLDLRLRHSAAQGHRFGCRELSGTFHPVFSAYPAPWWCCAFGMDPANLNLVLSACIA